MGLQVWMPMIGNINNQGLSNLSNLSGNYVQGTCSTFGKCLNVPNSSPISFMADGLVNAKKFSVCFWTLADKSTKTDWNQMLQLGDKKTDGSYGSNFRFESCKTYPRACSFHNNDKNAITAGSRILGSSNSTWYHVCVTYDGTELKSYTNGNLIGSYDYNSYKCNGGGTYHIEFEVSSTVQASTTDDHGNNTYVNINIGLYGKNTANASCWYIPFGCRSNSTGSVQKVSTYVKLNDDVRSFSTYIQCAGSGTFSGTLKIRNISIRRMADNALIVDGAITAAKIKSGEVTSDKIAANAITADKITTNNIAGTNGWINLRSGTFKYNDGALAWDGSTMTIGGFKISKYKIINDAIGICSTTGQEWAFWAGASSGANAPFHVGHNGSLYAENATIGGIIRAKQSISVYNATFATYQDVVKWDGSNLSIGLVGNAGSTGVKGAQIAFSGSQISVGNSSIVCGSISGTNSSFTNVWVENFTNASTFKENITCNRNLKVEGDLRFIDYEQSDSGNNANRRPVASVTADGSRVAYLSSAVKNSKHSIYVKGQYGKTGNNYSGYYFYNDATSDIRLKENIGVCNINALSAINKMNICSFDWKEEKNHQSLGLIADELEKIDPMLTLGGGYDSNGSMNVKCIDRLLLTEYAIKGIQELYEQYKLQKKEIQKLKKEIQKLK